MKTNNIDVAVAHGILKTINRFRDHPFLYLTASDLHASLLNDLVNGESSDLFSFKAKGTNLYLSKVHLDYPTGIEFIQSGAEGLEQEVSSAPSDHKKQKGLYSFVLL